MFADDDPQRGEPWGQTHRPFGGERPASTARRGVETVDRIVIRGAVVERVATDDRMKRAIEEPQASVTSGTLCDRGQSGCTTACSGLFHRLWHEDALGGILVFVTIVMQTVC